VHAVEHEIETLREQGLEIGLDKIAIMGCIVNGPGEARGADIGIAGGRNKGVLFRQGHVVKQLPEAQLLPALLDAIRSQARRVQSPCPGARDQG
jgi:4-hydroxy-3-methylbut-2-en-1-yl diphosphate synthase IspG/GcpE